MRLHIHQRVGPPHYSAVANAKTSEERSRQVRGMGETNEARVTAATNLVMAWREAFNAKPDERTRKQVEFEVGAFCSTPAIVQLSG
jgi:hypothetical protein